MKRIIKVPFPHWIITSLMAERIAGRTFLAPIKGNNFTFFKYARGQHCLLTPSDNERNEHLGIHYLLVAVYNKNEL